MYIHYSFGAFARCLCMNVNNQWSY